jgi:hypothetical protein
VYRPTKYEYERFHPLRRLQIGRKFMGLAQRLADCHAKVEVNFMRRRILKLAMPFAVLVAGLMFSSPFSSAKPDYMKREQKSCTYCHNAPNKKDLNETGRCYAEHGHSLDKCDPKRPVDSAR